MIFHRNPVENHLHFSTISFLMQNLQFRTVKCCVKNLLRKSLTCTAFFDMENVKTLSCKEHFFFLPTYFHHYLLIHSLNSWRIVYYSINITQFLVLIVPFLHFPLPFSIFVQDVSCRLYPLVSLVFDIV